MTPDLAFILPALENSPLKCLRGLGAPPGGSSPLVPAAGKYTPHKQRQSRSGFGHLWKFQLWRLYSKMKRRELINIGLEGKEVLKIAGLAIQQASSQGLAKVQIRKILKSLVSQPGDFLNDPYFSELAKCLAERNKSQTKPDIGNYNFQKELTYNVWGDEIETEAHQQMKNACSLPISVGAALMPDAHTGYGLPIGGVLATENAIIPYAVGVDIACRVMISVCDFPHKKIAGEQKKLEQILENNTRFGMGAAFQDKREHAVLDDNWEITQITSSLKDKAWSQLGTSGSGNHFVEFGTLELKNSFRELEPGTYFALVSHSGSRGPGSKVALYYSDLAKKQHPKLPKYLSHLSWLSMDGDGAEYWHAMQLMGRYASANHHVIHNSILKDLGTKAIFQVENHHNFAWKEKHFGKDLVVHRKGATPAGLGVLGYIPGTMVDPGYIVEGLGNEDSLFSSSHGAGRKLSRKRAKTSTTYSALKKLLNEQGIRLLSAGLDESPHAYKDIDEVMKAQKELVKKIAKFTPKIVKMAPDES